MAASFEVNADGLAEFLRSPEAMNALSEVAVLAGQAVQRAWPVRTGRSARQVVTGEARVVDGAARAAVGTSSSMWHFVEYGAANTPAYRPFASGLASIGLEYEPL